MNSESETDSLRELWQWQPLPAVSAEVEARVLRAVEAAEVRVKAESSPYGHILWWLLPLIITPSTILYCLAGETQWGPWVGQIYLWSVAFVMVVKHHLMLKYEREFGQTLLGRVERLYARELLYQRWSGLLGVGAVLFSMLILSTAPVEIFGVSARFSTIAGAAVALLMMIYAGISYPKYRSQMRQRLADLEAMRRELAG